MNQVELPDLEDIGKLIQSIYDLSLRASLLDIDIKIRESEINAEVSNNQKYFVNGKPPSQTYIDNTWKWTGVDGELVSKRKELAELNAKVESAKMGYRLLLTQIDVWRTQMANERVVST